jgi:hypothetical protein
MEPSYRVREPCPGAREAAPQGPGSTHRVAEAVRAGGAGAAPPGAEGRAGMRARGARDTRGEGERGGRERERGRERGEGSSPWDPKTDDNHPPDHLGQRGGRKGGEGEGVVAWENQMRERESGVPGARGGAPGWAGLG